MNLFRLALLSILCVYYTELLSQRDSVYFMYFMQKRYPYDHRFPNALHGWFLVEELPPNLGKTPYFSYRSRLYNGVFWFDAPQKPDTLSVTEYRRYKLSTPEGFFKRKGWDLNKERKVFHKEANNNNVQYYLFKRHKQHYLRYSLDSVYYYAYPRL